ncbi:MAG: hypothetical protein NC084_06325 [Bacteroides sp.]|nr:hypothetical protein [Eubacterium sp.]MCM1418159.1 hypothetical protein [Roseburia sp.]MCM1462316.1 hypothetical protein [Bacteroides sp.]
MSIRKILAASRPSEVQRTVLPLGKIMLEKDGIFLTVDLRDWNRTGLDTIV